VEVPANTTGDRSSNETECKNKKTTTVGARALKSKMKQQGKEVCQLQRQVASVATKQTSSQANQVDHQPIQLMKIDFNQSQGVQKLRREVNRLMMMNMAASLLTSNRTASTTSPPPNTSRRLSRMSTPSKQPSMTFDKSTELNSTGFSATPVRRNPTGPPGSLTDNRQMQEAQFLPPNPFFCYG